jgi:hypothetical protein
MRVSTAIDAIEKECLRACVKHPNSFHSAHEGYAVILEEVDELWDEVKLQTSRPECLRKEAIHVAAMALRFLIDVCEEEQPNA